MEIGQQKPDDGEDGGIIRQRPILATLASERLPADSHQCWSMCRNNKQPKINGKEINKDKALIVIEPAIRPVINFAPRPVSHVT